MSSYFIGRVSAYAILHAGQERPGTSPLVAILKRGLGSTCRLRGVRVYKGDHPTSLVIGKELAEWEERWQAGAEVGPVEVWCESRPTAAETPTNKGAVKRRKT